MSNHKLKGLIISPYLPEPNSNGGAIAQYFFLRKLSSIIEFTFIYINHNKSNLDLFKKLKEELPEVDFVIMDKSQQSWLLELKIFIAKILSFFKRKEMNLPNDFAVLPKIFQSDEINFVNNVINSKPFNFVQLEFYDSITLVNLIPSSIRKIFIHHELRTKKIELQSHSKGNKYYINTSKIIEVSLLGKFDKIGVFNIKDYNYLTSSGLESVYFTPFGIPESLMERNHVSNSFNKFLFIGSESHFCNLEGLTWFLNNIYLPNYNLIKFPVYITGNWSRNTRDFYQNFKKIVFTGYVDQLANLYDSSVLISPIISGSGIRTKILQAFLNKIPVLTTPFGAEGLFDFEKNSNHLLFFNNNDEFMKTYNEFVLDDDKLREIGVSGYNYYNVNFKDEYLTNLRLKLYE